MDEKLQIHDFHSNYAYICPRFWSVLPIRLRGYKFIEPVYRDALDMETLG
jgi:hypothetical protein